MPPPVAAVAPALASVFDFEFTLLGRVTARSARVCAAFRQAILSRLVQPDFLLDALGVLAVEYLVRECGICHGAHHSKLFGDKVRGGGY